MNLARVIKPYDAKRSRELEQRADRAYQAVGTRIRPAHKLHYAVQKYLLTGDEAAHNHIKELAPRTASFPDTFCMEAGGFTTDGNYWLASFSMSYLLETDLPTDPDVMRQFKAALKSTADKEIEWLNGNAYPFGWPINTDFRKQYNYGQGYATVQGHLSRERHYIDHLGSFAMNEFTVYQTLAFPAAIYPVLAPPPNPGMAK